MSRWFRHYAGMMRDDKLVRVAIRSRQTIERVVWIYGAILESASEIDDDGRYDFDPAEAAYFLRADEGDVDSVLRCLEDCGRICQGSVAKWGDRQFQSDRGAERQKRYRERQKEQQNTASDDGVTSPLRHRDAPETETETETELDTEDTASQCSATRQPISEALDFYNQNAIHAGWPTVAKLSASRRRALCARLREHGLEGWKAAITRARTSPYLGRDPPHWFKFDFLISETNFLKVIEGNYDRRNNGSADPTLVALSSFGNPSACG